MQKFRAASDFFSGVRDFLEGGGHKQEEKVFRWIPAQKIGTQKSHRLFSQADGLSMIIKGAVKKEYPA